jgi:hypothetical protein
MPGSRKWINDENYDFNSNYAFGGGVSSPGKDKGLFLKGGKKKAVNQPFPPPAWGQKKDSGSYFDSDFRDNFGTPTRTPKPWDSSLEPDDFSTSKFGTHFESDFTADNPQTRNAGFSRSRDSNAADNPFTRGSVDDDYQSNISQRSTYHSRSMSAATPYSQAYLSPGNLGSETNLVKHQRSFSLAQSPPYVASNVELTSPLSPQDGVAQAIALYSFQAVEVCIRSYLTWKLLVDNIVCYSFTNSLGIYRSRKAMSSLSHRRARAVMIGVLPVLCYLINSDFISRWTGKINNKEGVFPANFVEVV